MIGQQREMRIRPLWPPTREFRDLLGVDQDWRDSAACRQVGWEPFDPADDGERYSHYPARARAAAAVCAACPVSADCDAFAWERGCYGVWGGYWHNGRRGGHHRATPIEPRTRSAA